MQYVKKEFSLAIGDRTAEEIKIQMGSAWPMEEELTADIRGRDLISGLPRTIQLTTEHVREALAEPVSAIVDAVKTTLDKTPPELAADIMEDGITITGGGALLGGLDERLAHETGMPIRVADEPLYSVVIGSGRALENIDAMRGLMSLGGDDVGSSRELLAAPRAGGALAGLRTPDPLPHAPVHPAGAGRSSCCCSRRCSC